jgi:plasmid stabilization system protein ParE
MTMAHATINLENPEQGCRIYNKDNKENEDNKENMRINNPLFSSSSGRSANASLLDTSVALKPKEEAEPLDSMVVVKPPTPLSEDQIKSAVFQLFDNGEATAQRYKLKIRLNLTDGENPEFIASLTKDLRNFKKYIPQTCREQVCQEVQAIRTRIKASYGSFPYMGKFHMNSGPGRAHSQTEPCTWVTLWYDNENKGWSGMYRIYDWYYQFDLFSEYVTAKQKSRGVKSQGTYTNPTYDKIQRPMTWAEQRARKNG